MKSENLQEGMYISVTDEYRSKMLESITWGKGFGLVIGFDKRASAWFDELEIEICTIKWADGAESTMHPIHLQQSTKKAFFKATLEG